MKASKPRSRWPTRRRRAWRTGDAIGVNVIDDADGYAIEGNQIVSATLMKRWDYCVSGDALRYRDVSSSGELEPGIIELGRR